MFVMVIVTALTKCCFITRSYIREKQVVIARHNYVNGSRRMAPRHFLFTAENNHIEPYTTSCTNAK